MKRYKYIYIERVILCEVFCGAQHLEEKFEIVQVLNS